MRFVPVSFGQARDAESREISEITLAQAEKESRWQLGQARIGGVIRSVERKKQLDGYAYRFRDQLLDPSCIETYLPNEYFDWRDS